MDTKVQIWEDTLQTIIDIQSDSQQMFHKLEASLLWAEISPALPSLPFFNHAAAPCFKPLHVLFLLQEVIPSSMAYLLTSTRS
jgi:hypothetical protein